MAPASPETVNKAAPRCWAKKQTFSYSYLAPLSVDYYCFFKETSIIFNSSWDINVSFKQQQARCDPLDASERTQYLVTQAVQFKCICGVMLWLLTFKYVVPLLQFSIQSVLFLVSFYTCSLQLQPTGTKSCLNNSTAHARCTTNCICPAQSHTGL